MEPSLLLRPRVARYARVYFGLQAVLVAGWWAWLVVSPAGRAAFRAFGAPDVTLFAFAPGDLALLVLGSSLVALSRGRWARPLAWLVAGAVVYAAAYTLALAAWGAAELLGAALMTPAAAGALLAARALDDVG